MPSGLVLYDYFLDLFGILAYMFMWLDVPYNRNVTANELNEVFLIPRDYISNLKKNS